MENKSSLAKNDFFPYDPYECQHLFMEKIFETLMNKKAGIFESPTGTGKSLSILCGVLKYLTSLTNLNSAKNNQECNNITTNTNTNISTEDDWLNNFGKTPDKPPVKIQQPSITQIQIDLKKRKHSELNSINTKQIKPIPATKFKTDNILPTEIESKKMLINDSLLLPHNSSKKNDKLQVFFCTRTHSQIAQVISEIKKIKNSYKSEDNLLHNLSFTCLGSRKLLCTNKKVKANNSFFNINEKCLELTQSSSEAKCPYYQVDLIDSFANEMSNSKVYDIEELYKLGEDISACPYFSSRKAMDLADIIVLPYNSILNNKIRKSLNIDLENKILIFDEAHNLVENVLQTYNAEITYDNLVLILLGLNLYYEKYSSRLKASSNMYLRQLIKVLESLIKLLNDNLQTNNNKNKDRDTSIPQSLSEVLIELDISNLNFFNLINFIQATELHNKVKWTLEKFVKENLNQNAIKENSSEEKKTTDIKAEETLLKYLKNANTTILTNLSFENIKRLLYQIELFSGFSDLLNAFTYTNEDGKITFEFCESIFTSSKRILGKIKYIMVNPCREFDHIIKESKCVIFAGGTMKPIEEFQLLLKCLKKEQIEFFEGSHVVDKSNILVSNISVDFTLFNKLIFNHDNFCKNEIFLLESILNIVKFHSDEKEGNNLFPNNKGKGIVVFLHTYSLIEKVKLFNKKNKVIQSVDILYEEKEKEKTSSHTDIFQQYQDNIKTLNKKTILFSVVGGKLSEGINFSDELARVVLVFGLPYPNINSSELKIKMEYFNSLYKRGESKINGEEYYENICMKAVNQSIGRSIRHKNDYAVIVLVDVRYSKEKIKNKLPKWILNSKVKTVSSKESLDEYKRDVREFFSNKEGII